MESLGLLGLSEPLGARLDASWRRLGLERRPEAKTVNDGERFGAEFVSLWASHGPL